MTPATVRLSDPGEVLAALPSLCGFPPADSLVLLSLRGRRARVGLTMRADLPPPGDPPADRALAELAANRMAGDGASSVVVAVYADDALRPELVEAVTRACAARGVRVLEALHVRADRWTSYACSGPCCPAEGTPVPYDGPRLRALAVEQVLAGRAVLPSRAALVASLAPPDPAAARPLPPAGPAAGTVALADALLDATDRGEPAAPDALARLAAGLHDVRARDAVALRILDRGPALLALLLATVRVVGPPGDAPACALLAWAAHAAGDGALANVALDRALAGDPELPLARLLRDALDAGVPSAEVRAVLREVAATTPG